MSSDLHGAGTGPLIVQSDLVLLLEVEHPQYEAARDALAGFAEMVKSPEYIHTYRLSQLSLWNAASAGISAEQVLETLQRYAKHEVPSIVRSRVLEWGSRYGKIILRMDEGGLLLECADRYIAQAVAHDPKAAACCEGQLDELRFRVLPTHRGRVKQALIAMEYPAEDLAGYNDAAELAFGLRQTTAGGEPFALRSYQQEAVDIFYAGGAARGGHGVIVLPCGAGKTVVGIAAMEKFQMETLVLTTSIVAVRQWIGELLDKTTLTEEQIGEYSGDKKEIRPVTVSTYQLLSAKEAQATHFSLMDSRNWGLIVYDEVHTLPAPVFRVTAELQARRRLGLTATLIREDGLESDVFSLIGPKRYEVPWKVLERSGHIAQAQCAEVRVPLAEEARMPYAVASNRLKFRIAAENSAKLPVIQKILDRHPTAHVLIIGQYLDQLKEISQALKVPLLTGKTPNKKREELYERFRSGEIPVIVVSKVANYAIDLPDANVAVEVSGSFGSRQEEAQRLGRILRPKPGENKAWFYMLCSADTCEQAFAAHRQLFLTEQGYPYDILDGM